MPTVIAKLRVSDFDTWHEEFESMHAQRAAHGDLGHTAYRSPVDPHLVVVIFEWDNHDRARAYFNGPELAASVERADVRGAPHVLYLEQA